MAPRGRRARRVPAGRPIRPVHQVPEQLGQGRPAGELRLPDLVDREQGEDPRRAVVGVDVSRVRQRDHRRPLAAQERRELATKVGPGVADVRLEHLAIVGWIRGRRRARADGIRRLPVLVQQGRQTAVGKAERQQADALAREGAQPGPRLAETALAVRDEIGGLRLVAAKVVAHGGGVAVAGGDRDDERRPAAGDDALDQPCGRDDLVVRVRRDDHEALAARDVDRRRASGVAAHVVLCGPGRRRPRSRGCGHGGEAGAGERKADRSAMHAGPSRWRWAPGGSQPAATVSGRSRPTALKRKRGPRASRPRPGLVNRSCWG